MTFLKLLSFTLFTLLTATSHSKLIWSVPIKSEFYIPHDSRIENDVSISVQPSIKIEYKNVDYKFESFIRYSINQESRRYILPQDNFINFMIHDDWSILIGTKIYNWGFLEVFSPMDFLNSRNYNASFFSDEKVGEPVIELKGYTLIGDIELIYQPFLVKPVYPEVDSPFGFGFEFANPQWNTSNESPQTAQLNQGFPQFTLKLEKSFNGIDLLAFYSRHYEKNHFYVGTTSFSSLPTDPPTFIPLSAYNVPQMIDMQKFGLGLVKSYQNILFKTELIHNSPIEEIEIYNPITGLSNISSHTVWNLGGQWNPKIHPAFNSSFFIEWQKVYGYDSKQQRQIFEIFQNDLAFIFKLSNNAIYEQSLNLAIIYDLEIRQQYIFSLSYEKRINESLKLITRSQWIETPTLTETNFNLLENRSHLLLAFEYFF